MPGPHSAAPEHACTRLRTHTYATTHNNRGWQTRRIVLSERRIFFFKEDSNHIVDLIPLHEISQVSQGIPHHLLTQQTLKRSTSGIFERTLAHGKHHLLSNERGKELSVEGLDKALTKANLAHTREAHGAELEEGEDRGLVIHTLTTGVFDGKTYFLRCENVETSKKWAETANKALNGAKKRHALLLTQRRVESVYMHPLFQGLIAVLIMANFLSSMAELQIRDRESKVFEYLDVFFTIIFLVELIMNSKCIYSTCIVYMSIYIYTHVYILYA